jgi:hypothetical protein
MKKLLAFSVGLAGCLLPDLAQSQAPNESVSLVLITWVQAGSATTGTTATAQSVVGTFPDLTKCITAAQQARLSNGATALAFNFMCIANR